MTAVSTEPRAAESESRAAALEALQQVHDQLTVALDTLQRLHNLEAARHQVGKSSDRLATAIYHLRRLVRERA